MASWKEGRKRTVPLQEEEGERDPPPKRTKANERFDSGASPCVFFQNTLAGAGQVANVETVGLRDLMRVELQSAVLTSYVVEWHFLLAECPALRRVPTVVIHDDASLAKCEVQTLSAYRARVSMPYGTGHGKVMLLFCRDFLRVVVTTANLCESDWNSKIQGVWFQDFPVLGESEHGIQERRSELAQDFLVTLEDYFTRLGHVDASVRLLRRYDFSAVKVYLVTSVPGIHKGSIMSRYGHLKVSSIGSLSPKWLAELGTSFGLSNETVRPDNCAVVWPTVDFVRNCVDGYAAGGSLCLPERNLKDFLRPYLAIWEPAVAARCRYPPHIKSYGRVDGSRLDWVLLTSANLSKAAWGEMQKSNTQLMIRSFEAGVLFIPEKIMPSAQFFAAPAPAHCSSRVQYPFPTAVPTRAYNYTQGDVPWIWDVPHDSPDILGHSHCPR